MWLFWYETPFICCLKFYPLRISLSRPQQNIKYIFTLKNGEAMQANLFSSYFMHSAFIDIYPPFQQLGPARLKRSPYLHFCLIFQNNIYN